MFMSIHRDLYGTAVTGEVTVRAFLNRRASNACVDCGRVSLHFSKLFSYYGVVLYRLSECPKLKFNFQLFCFVTGNIYYYTFE
jgi:hypothetical protein